MIALMCKGDRPHAKYCVKSFKQYMPSHRFIQITDLHSPHINRVDEVIRHDWPTEIGMMVWMIRSFAELQWKDVLITTADDCIIDAPIDTDGDYDVAIVRRTAKFHYTNGLVIVKSREFYNDCYQNLLEIADDIREGQPYRDWLGDMACIQNVIDSGKYRVHLLPEEYFRKPSKPGKGKDGKTILWHYAGLNRKPWMQHHGRIIENSRIWI